MQLAGFGRKTAGDAGNAAVVYRCHPGKNCMAVDQKAFTNRVFLLREQEAAVVVEAGFFE